MNQVPSTPKKPKLSAKQKQLLREGRSPNSTMTINDDTPPPPKIRKLGGLITGSTLFRAHAILKGAYNAVQHQMKDQGT